MYSTEVQNSIETFLTHDARFVRLIHAYVDEALAHDGIRALEQGLHRFGTWQMQRALARWRMPATSAKFALILQHWQAGELALHPNTEWGQVHVNEYSVQLAFSESPAITHFREHHVPDLAEWYYGNVFGGAGAVCGLAAPSVNSDDGGVTLIWPDVVSDTAGQEIGGQLSEYEVSLHTVQGRGALMAYLGKPLLQDFGATGEYCLRSALAQFGEERGHLLGRKIDALKLERNIENTITNYDSGGHTSVWRWAPGGQLTADKQFQDCTFCPFIPVWRELDAMDVGQIYDYEFHVNQFRAVNPSIRLRWDAIQTEGADHCAFRFTLPENAPRPDLGVHPD